MTRKVHTNTSWDKARFESCAQKWMDFSEGPLWRQPPQRLQVRPFGAEGVIGLTLIKCGVEPNPMPMWEMHTFTYALYPHAGTWKEARTVEESLSAESAYAVQGGRPTRPSQYRCGAHVYRQTF